MGNNVSRSTQWSEEPVKPTGPICGAMQPSWPFKVCNRKPNHDSDHCQQKQQGIAMVDVWWPKHKEPKE
jgi:hypothetical protein